MHGDHLLALTPQGTIDWAREVPSPYWEFSPVIGKDGTVYVGGRNWDVFKDPISVLYAYHPDGSLKWTFTSKYFVAAPALDDESTIYFSADGGMHAVDAEGRLKWLFDTEPLWSYSTPAVSSDHVIYFGLDRWLFAVGPDGKFKWRFETAGKVGSSPAIDAEGNVWFGSCDRHLYCVDQHGSRVGDWRFERMACATPLIDRRGRIYLRDGRSLRVLSGPNGPSTDSSWPMKRHDSQGTGQASSPQW